MKVTDMKNFKELFGESVWEEHGWDNNTFTFSFGDFIDVEGDKFYFSIDYRKDLKEFIFFMIYDDCSIIYDCQDYLNMNKFFETHLSKEIMEEIKSYMRSIM